MIRWLYIMLFRRFTGPQWEECDGPCEYTERYGFNRHYHKTTAGVRWTDT